MFYFCRLMDESSVHWMPFSPGVPLFVVFEAFLFVCLQNRHTADPPPNHLNRVKMFKGQPCRFVLWELVPNWYKSFPPDHFG